MGIKLPARIRFLQPPAGAGRAFYPGQIIEIDKLDSELTAWLTVPLADGSFRAEVVGPGSVVPDVGIETAALESAAMAVLPRGRPRKAK